MGGHIIAALDSALKLLNAKRGVLYAVNALKEFDAINSRETIHNKRFCNADRVGP